MKYNELSKFMLRIKNDAPKITTKEIEERVSGVSISLKREVEEIEKRLKDKVKI